MTNLDDMAIFTRVVEAGSFTGAARALELPKSTVSRRLALLEESLGARLLERTTRTLKLTEIGAAYFERCSRIVGEAEEANLAVTRMLATPRGNLRVNSLAMARDAAAAGLGLAALPEMICWEALRSGRLRVVLKEWTLPGTGLYAVYPTRRHLSAKVRSFIDCLQERLTPPPWKSA